MQDMQGAPAPEQESADSEDMVVDQIGALLQKLSPEKQKQVVMQLEQLLSADQGTVAPEAGPHGVPAEHV